MRPAEAHAALLVETERAHAFFAALAPEDYLRPTRCAPLTVLELGAHAWRGSERVSEMLAAGPLDDEPEKDAVTYFRYDAAGEAAAIVERAQAAGRELTPATFPSRWLAGWQAALDASKDALVRDAVYRTPFGSLHLSEYLRTRVLEVTIHTMDAREALGLSPDPTAEGLEVTCGVLRGLLGTDLREMGIDDVRFALTGTGRESLDESEREQLGPLAGLFPLLR